MKVRNRLSTIGSAVGYDTKPLIEPHIDSQFLYGLKDSLQNLTRNGFRMG